MFIFDFLCTNTMGNVYLLAIFADYLVTNPCRKEISHKICFCPLGGF